MFTKERAAIARAVAISPPSCGWRATCRRCCPTTDAEGVILSKDCVEGLVSGTNIIFRGGSEFEFVPFLRRCCRATCRCCATTDVVGVILSKDRVEGLVSGTNIIFLGGFEFKYVHDVFIEGAHCADGAGDVGGRGIHWCCLMKN